jgi:glycosyltransferase involved in cell wall biosynthesis
VTRHKTRAYKSHRNPSRIQEIKYSVCITNYNSIDTIRRSMESLFRELDNNFEVVVCDNLSDDGSLDILKEYAQRGKIHLIIKKSGRGKGRQTAFEYSTGNYIISGIDTDDQLKANFKNFLNAYHLVHEGYMLSAGTIHIIPRCLVEKIGGWRDLKWGEDVDFFKRAKSLGMLHEFQVPIDLVERGDNKRSFLARASERYEASKFYYMIGRSVADQVRMSALSNKPLIFFFAVLSNVLCKLYHTEKLQYTGLQR